MPRVNPGRRQGRRGKTPYQHKDTPDTAYEDAINHLREQISQQPPLNRKMERSLDELRGLCDNPVVEAAFNEAVSNVYPYTETGSVNPWQYFTIQDFQLYFRCWYTYLPPAGGGLGYILPFTLFYLNNKSAYHFLNEFKSMTAPSREYKKEIFRWTTEFVFIRGQFMDSPESTGLIDEWMESPSSHMEDFIIPPGGFKSFNEFFTRELNPKANARPINEPDDDSIVVASADTILNFILSDLTLKTEMNVKGRQISMHNLLNKSKYAKDFVGGTAISCVLMPDVYHHYHSPVTGTVVESCEVPGVYNGIIDGDDWFGGEMLSNIGESTTEFSIFEDFHRSYFVIKTEKYGYVGFIPVGLNTISRIQATLVNDKSVMVPPDSSPSKHVPIKKGDKIGNFAYGGSLNILIFQKGSFGAISVLQGQRIGELTPPIVDE